MAAMTAVGMTTTATEASIRTGRAAMTVTTAMTVKTTAAEVMGAVRGTTANRR